jgi:hypothetical protein
MPRERIRPPDWWNQNLYSFVQTMPPEGWFWEFMRRARLLKILEGAPVDAMNPNPNTRILSADDAGYYKSWPWYRENDRFPAFLPPAVFPPSGWPRGFHGQQYRTYDPLAIQQQSNEGRIIKVRVDLNRRDSVIKRDFSACLESMRDKHPEPKRMNPRLSNWPDMHILEVWDLHQFRVSLIEILLGFGRSRQRNEILADDLPPVRNAYNSARSYINGGKWVELALHIDLEEDDEEKLN